MNTKVTDLPILKQAPALRGLEGALVAALESQGSVVLIKSMPDGRYQYASTHAAQDWLLGVDPIGMGDADLFMPEQAMILRAADQQAMVQSKGISTEHHVERRGETRHYVVWRQALQRPDGRPLGLLCSWHDVTAQRSLEQRLQSVVLQLEQQQRNFSASKGEASGQPHVRDQISGLYNRLHFEEQLRREADLSTREQREFAIVAMAVDGMDRIRHAHGPEACERVIESLGRLLRDNTRVMDSPCRLGGERFVVLLSGIGLASAHARMEQFRKQCAQHVVANQAQQIAFTVSMGIASFPHTAGSVDELMKSADRALMQSRDKGGNHLTLSSIQLPPKL